VVCGDNEQEHPPLQLRVCRRADGCDKGLHKSLERIRPVVHLDEIGRRDSGESAQGKVISLTVFYRTIGAKLTGKCM